MQATKRNFAVLLCAVAICVGSRAEAQANPELGDTGAPAGTWAPPAASASASASTEEGAEASVDTSDSAPSASPSGTGAHADVVGTFGIGFFGITDVPVCLDGGCDTGAVATPAIGLRYWLNETIGIEGGLGIGISSGTQTLEPAGGATDENLDVSTTAFLLHGAVPLALAYNGNFVFEVVPELDFGFATGTAYDNNAPMGAAPNDTDISGLLFRLGARAGAEVHFGFIGMPQLALQGTVGLHLTLASRSQSNTGGDVSHSTTNIGTSVQGEPWDIFTGNITAIYYFMN